MRSTGSEITTDADNEESEFLWGNTFKKVAGCYKIVGGDDFELAGANASAEEEADTGSAETEKVIDKVDAAKLEPMGNTPRCVEPLISVFDRVGGFRIHKEGVHGIPQDLHEEVRKAHEGERQGR